MYLTIISNGFIPNSDEVSKLVKHFLDLVDFRKASLLHMSTNQDYKVHKHEHKQKHKHTKIHAHILNIHVQKQQHRIQINMNWKLQFYIPLYHLKCSCSSCLMVEESKLLDSGGKQPA